MNILDRNVLARDLVGRMTAAACRDHTAAWNAAERNHRSASTQEQALAAANQVVHLCGDCPVSGLCTQWAGIDRYTGLAAGRAWVAGVPRGLQVVRDRRKLNRLPLAS